MWSFRYLLLCKCKTLHSASFITHNTRDLKIASLDVRGLGNNAKRREVFNWQRAKKESIYVTFHVKTHTHGFVLNGQSRWVAVDNSLKAFTKALEVLQNLLCFFPCPLEVLKKAMGNFSQAVGSVGKSRENNSFYPSEMIKKVLI